MTWHRIDDPENPPPRDKTLVLLWNGGPVVGFWNGRTWDDGDFYDDLGAVSHWSPITPPVTP